MAKKKKKKKQPVPVSAPVSTPAPAPASAPASISQVPKNFLIRCPKCRWGRTSTGCKDDLQDLKEVPSSPVEHTKRRFRCPKCGAIAEMHRVRGNAPLSPPPVEGK